MTRLREFYESYWQWREEHFDYRARGVIPQRHLIALQTIRTFSATSFNEGDTELRILDVGCGEGLLGELLQKELGKQAPFIIGVDIAHSALEKAKPYYTQVLLADAENLSRNFVHAGFKVIVALETIEHVFAPDKLLASCKLLLGDDGILVISTPNIAHYKNRIEFLRGVFPDSASIYDSKEHLHHFTYDSMTQALRDSGFHLLNYDGSFQVPKMVSKVIGYKFSYRLFRRFPNLLGKQIVYIASHAGQRS